MKSLHSITFLWQHSVLPFLSLLTSISTLLCCALPALLVSVGLGATLAGLFSNMPWITKLSDYKAIIFTVSGLLLLVAAFVQYLSRNSCPADPAKGRICMKLKKVNIIVLAIAAIFYFVGLFFAYFAADILL